MRERYRRLKGDLVTRATDVFTAAVQASMNPEKAASDADKIRSKYRGMPIDAIAELLVCRAARKTKCPGPGLHRFLHGPDCWLAGALRPRGARPRSPARPPLQRHRASRRPLDGPADRGRLPRPLRPVLPPPRSPSELRTLFPTESEAH